MKAKCDAKTPCNRCRLRQLTCDRRPINPPRGRLGQQRDTAASHSGDTDSVDCGAFDDPATPFGGETTGLTAVPDETRQTEQSAQVSKAEPPSVPVSQDHVRVSMSASSEASRGGAYLPPSSFSNAVRIGPDLTPPQQWTDSHQNVSAYLNPLSDDNNEHNQARGYLDNGRDLSVTGSQTLMNFEGQTFDFRQSQVNQNDTWNDISSFGEVEAPDHPVIIQAQEYWSAFHCNPSIDMTECPRTAGILLKNLSHIPEVDKLWGWLSLDSPGMSGESEPLSLPVMENTRDRLSAISQSFLQKALEVHQLDRAMASTSYPSPGHELMSTEFLILPPSATLEHFLREYMRLFEPFYGLVPGGLLDVNTLIVGNNRAATLLVLLMIAQGAMSDPTNEARRLSGGLTEVCRISLFDMMEKYVALSYHHLSLHCSILFIIQAAWSGDKWLMDIGMGQRGIYIAVGNPSFCKLYH